MRTLGTVPSQKASRPHTGAGWRFARMKRSTTWSSSDKAAIAVLMTALRPVIGGPGDRARNIAIFATRPALAVRVLVEKTQPRTARHPQEPRSLRDPKQGEPPGRDIPGKGFQHQPPRLGVAAGGKVDPSGFPEMGGEDLPGQAAPFGLPELRREDGVGEHGLDGREVVFPIQRQQPRGAGAAHSKIR